MKIPKKLKIGGIIYRINQDEELDSADGEFESQKREIRLCKKLSQEMKELALFHEILEVGCSPLGEKEIGHSLLEMISQLYYQVLKDNDLLK